jgi:RHS repeat-associated protein
LEEINKLVCVQTNEDGWIIDPVTGYIYDPVTGLPIDLTGSGNGSGTGGGNNNQPFLDCYNKFLSFIDYYQDKENKPEEYDILVMYLSCLNGDCSTCLTLPYTKLEGRECFVDFCDLTVPDLPEEEEEEEVEIPDFPEIDLGTGVDDTWDDEEPEPTELESDPFVQRGPVWWYHSDHLGSTSYITDILGMPCQYIEYLPFGEVMVQQSTNNIFENVYKFNAKELDESTGYYYYGARYYDPAISIFLSVDPLAEEFPNYNPYTYTMNNPVNLVDPTGMAPEEGDGHYYGSDGKTYLGTDGKSDNKAYTLNSGKTANFNNKSVNWGGKLDAKHAAELRKNSTESVFDTSKVDNRVSTIHRTGNGGFDPSKVDGAITESLLYDLPQGLQNVGDGMAVLGYGLTLTVVGAEIGVPLAAAGNALSGIGTGIEIGVSMIDGDLNNAGTKLGLMATDKVIGKGLNRVLPGSADIYKKNFSIEKAILTQGASLKVNAADKIIQHQKEN